MKNLSIIACISRDGGLGKTGQLLWHIPEDMALFKQTTLGHTVVMGRKTFESIGRPLPQRQNIVLTRSELDATGIEVFHSQSALDQYLSTFSGEKFIIGGASLYGTYLDLADKLYLTEVDAVRPADTYFPTFDQSKYRRNVLKAGTYGGTDFEIVEYTRRIPTIDQHTHQKEHNS